MPLYESVVIARQDISTAQVEGLADELTGIVEAGGGSVKKKEQWGLRNLSFRIKKNRKGHYFLLGIDAPGTAIAEYERVMRLNEDILRYQTIRVDEIEEGPSAVLAKGGRDERGPRGGGPRRPGGHFDSGRGRGGEGRGDDRPPRKEASEGGNE